MFRAFKGQNAKHKVKFWLAFVYLWIMILLHHLIALLVADIRSTIGDDVTALSSRIASFPCFVKQALCPAATFRLKTGTCHSIPMTESPWIDGDNFAYSFLIHILDPWASWCSARHGTNIQPIVFIPGDTIDNGILLGTIPYTRKLFHVLVISTEMTRERNGCKLLN